MITHLPELEGSSTWNCSSLKKSMGMQVGNGDTKKVISLKTMCHSQGRKQPGNTLSSFLHKE